MNYDAHFKLHPDSHQTNYWRFRQHNPIDKAIYSTKKLTDGNLLVLDHHSKPYTTEYKKTKEISTNLPGKNGAGTRK